MSFKKMLISGTVVFTGNVGGALFGLMRNILIARLISVENFGIAASFSLIIAALDIAGDIGIDRMLIQAKDGNKASFQGNIQFVSAMRGVVFSAILFFTAPLIADFFKIPEVTWAFQFLALSPMLRGLVHYDATRAQKRMNFVPAAAMMFVPQLIALILAIPFCLIFNDYRAPLFVSFCQVLMVVVVSHFFAGRPYRWSIDKDILIRVYAFGWPLILNGIVFSLVIQGDKALIGRFFSIDMFGVFSAAFGLVYLLASIIVQILKTYFLPILSAAKENFVDLKNRASVVIQLYALIGLMLALGSSILGPSLLILLYGPKYFDGASLMATIGLMQGMRVARSSLTTISFAVNLTKITLYMTIARSVGLGLAVIFVLYGYNIEVLLLCSVVGELIAFFAGGFWINQHTNLMSRAFLPTLSFLAVIALMGMAISHRYINAREPWLELGIGAIGLAITFIVIIICMKSMRIELMRILNGTSF